MGRELPAGQRGVARGESGVNWARGAGIFGRRGAAQQRGPHLSKPSVRSEALAQRNVAWLTARSHRRTQQRCVTPWRGMQSRPGADRPAGQHQLQAENRGSGLCLEHASRACADAAKGATTPPHLCKPSSWATDAKKTWGEIGRPGSDALPAENRENNLRTGHASRASWDAVARCNSAGRIFANRRSGER